MLKSLLISLRRKPKVIRDQVALFIAGAFTLMLFGMWAFTIPGSFSDGSESQSASLFSTFRTDLETDTDQLDEVLSDIQAVIDTETDNANQAVLPVDTTFTSPGTSTGTATRPIRLTTATTSTTSDADFTE